MISVLIVEDEPLIAEAHQAYLQRLQGFTVTAVAHTARDAMRAAGDAAANETPIDLVLLDIGLPDASGIALASGLSGLRPAPDIIAITRLGLSTTYAPPVRNRSSSDTPGSESRVRDMADPCIRWTC